VEELKTSPQDKMTNQVRSLIEKNKLDDLQLLVNDFHPADIADVLDDLSP